MNDNMTLTLRPISAGDIADVMRIQAQCYPVSMQEPEDVVLSRIEAAGHTSLVAHAGNAGVCAYVFAYPGKLGGVTKLNRAFALPVNPDTLYIHDLAVPPGAAGKGLARKLVAGLVDLAGARRLVHAALVSVQDSQAFWERLGFAVTQPDSPGSREALATYPGGACYMTMPLEP
jgi:ribosomal protein S18 acetylase RimI-like enzyme